MHPEPDCVLVLRWEQEDPHSGAAEMQNLLRCFLPWAFGALILNKAIPASQPGTKVVFLV